MGGRKGEASDTPFCVCGICLNRGGFTYLADWLWLGDLSAVPVGHQGVKDEEQPLQLLCCLLCFFPFCLHDAQDLHHTELEVKTERCVSFTDNVTPCQPSGLPPRPPTKPGSAPCQRGLLQPGPCDPALPSQCPTAERVQGWLRVRAYAKQQGKSSKNWKKSHKLKAYTSEFCIW